MKLNIPKNVEQFINVAVQSGRYASADDMITKLVVEDARHAQAHADEPQDVPEKWTRQLQAWVATHPARPLPIDDSRESIYAGRGE